MTKLFTIHAKQDADEDHEPIEYVVFAHDADEALNQVHSLESQDGPFLSIALGETCDGPFSASAQVLGYTGQGITAFSWSSGSG